MAFQLMEINETPDAPLSGRRQLYAKSDGIYEQDSGNVAVKLANVSELGNVTLAQRLYNFTGGTLNVGDVVIMDTSIMDTVATTTAPKDLRVLGTAAETIDNMAYGLFNVVSGSIAYITIAGTVAVGDWLSASSTVKKAFSVGPVRERGAFAVALSSGTDTTISCMLYTNPELTSTGTYSYSIGGTADSINGNVNAYKFTHASATVAYLASANLPAALLGNSGIGNTTLAGYSSGGTPNTYGNSVVSGYKMPYSTETTSVNGSLALGTARCYVSRCGANSSTKGYIVGGNNIANTTLTTTDKCTFSTDTMSVSTAASRTNYFGIAISDGTVAFESGGSRYTTDKRTFSTDTCAANVDSNLPGGGGWGALSFSTTGYLAIKLSGTSYSVKIPFATGVRANNANVLTQLQAYCAMFPVNATNGWFIGDIYTSPFTQSSKFTLSTETYTIDNGAAMPAGRYYGASFTNGAY
jgi:hypothetical protein